MKTQKQKLKGKGGSKKPIQPTVQGSKPEQKALKKLKASITKFRRIQPGKKSSTSVEVEKQRVEVLQTAAQHLTHVTTTLERLGRSAFIAESFVDDLDRYDPLGTNLGVPLFDELKNHDTFEKAKRNKQTAYENAMDMLKPLFKMLGQLFNLPAHNGLEDLATEALVHRTCSLSTYLNKYFDENQASYPSQVVNGLMFCQIFTELILKEESTSSLRDRCICYSDNIQNVTEFKVGVICGYIKISDILNAGLVYVPAFSTIDRLELRSFLKSYVRLQSEI